MEPADRYTFARHLDIGQKGGQARGSRPHLVSYSCQTAEAGLEWRTVLRSFFASISGEDKRELAEDLTTETVWDVTILGVSDLAAVSLCAAEGSRMTVHFHSVTSAGNSVIHQTELPARRLSIRDDILELERHIAEHCLPGMTGGMVTLITVVPSTGG